MTISPFLIRQSFDPETIHAMGIAFDDACKSLGLTNGADAITEIVAKRVIELGQMGIRDPDLLLAEVLATFRQAC